MKYRYIVSTICCLLFWEPVSQAQEVAWFEAEGNVYYEVTNCRPLSDVMFYSADKGGKLLQTITTDENGRFQASERITLGKTSASIVPVAALNTKKKNSSGIAGTGMLRNFSAKEFSLKKITLDKAGRHVKIDWYAESNPLENLKFQILGSYDGVNYTVIEEVTAAKSVVSYPYSYLSSDNPHVFFKISVITEKNGHRYTSRLLALDEGKLNVYPTITEDVLNVVHSGENSVPYKILNNQGQVVRSGTLDKPESTVSVSDLSSGNYMLITDTHRTRSVARFIRQ